MMRQSDPVDKLSVDDTEPTYKEKNMLDMLYPQEAEQAVVVATTVRKLSLHFKDILTGMVLFVVLSLPITDAFIQRFLPIEDANYRLAVKAVLFAIFFFLCQYAYTMPKQST